MKKYNNVEEYLKDCGVETAEQLSEQQVADWFESDNVYPIEKHCFIEAMNGGVYGDYPQDKALDMAKQAMSQHKILVGGIIMNEGLSEFLEPDGEDKYELALEEL